MSEEERIAEKAKSLAGSVYRQLDEAQRAENYVRTTTEKWGEHPAFRQYMADLLLADRLAEFLARPKMTRA